MDVTSKEIATLNTLFTTLNGSINGYRDAAEDAKAVFRGSDLDRVARLALLTPHDFL